MRRIVAALAVGSSFLLLTPEARAQTAPESHTYTAVDAVKVDHFDLHITGVLEGEAGSSTLAFFFNVSSAPQFEQRQSCERLALLAMARPGFYTLNVTVVNHGYPSCTLGRATP